METGRPFSMQQNNTLFSISSSSIFVHEDGFSFCNASKVHRFGFTKRLPSLDELRTWLEQHGLNSKTAVDVVYCNGKAITVPMPLFEESDVDLYLKTAVTVNEEKGAFHRQESIDKVVVYPRAVALEERFQGLFSESRSMHVVSHLLPYLTDLTKGNIRRSIYVHLREGFFDLFLFQGSQLLLQNSFQQENADEFLYFLFYVTEQYYLKPEEFDLFFLGTYPRFNAYYEGAKTFHESIAFVPSALSLQEEQHPVPFFQTFMNG